MKHALHFVFATLAVMANLAAAAPAADPKAAPCVDHLKRLATASMMYAQDHGSKFPTAANGKLAYEQVKSYAQDPGIDNCPAGGKIYLFNTDLSGVALASVKAPADTPLFIDPAPHSDGTVGIAFADGHVKRFPTVNARRYGGKFK